jgi:hypothetical protein
VFARQAQALVLFDQTPMRFGICADKAQRHAAFPGPAGAADAMNVVQRRAWQVVVRHDRQLRNVDAAGSDIGGDHHLQPGRLEIGQHLRVVR